MEEFRPNTMQLQFINALNVLVNKKKTKALLLSATGTGKTFAAAFAIRDLVIEPKKNAFSRSSRRDCKASAQNIF